MILINYPVPTTLGDPGAVIRQENIQGKRTLSKARPRTLRTKADIGRDSEP